MRSGALRSSRSFGGLLGKGAPSSEIGVLSLNPVTSCSIVSLLCGRQVCRVMLVRPGWEDLVLSQETCTFCASNRTSKPILPYQVASYLAYVVRTPATKAWRNWDSGANRRAVL